MYNTGVFPWHDGRFCGDTGDEYECACGCSAFDELCDWERYIDKGEPPISIQQTRSICKAEEGND